MADRAPYWFPAKRYGWGWGPPTAWQGWVVLMVWGIALAVALHRFLPLRRVTFATFIALWTASLLAICYWKGEPPSWRWGDRR